MRARVLFLLLILLGFGLRLFLLGSQSLWYDEGVTATIAQRDLLELTRWTANDIQPPLYYYLVALWGRLGGWSEWSLRWPSAVLGVLALPLLGAVAYRLMRLRGAALLAVLLAALHPLLVYYGQEARMYTLLVCLAILLAYLLLRIADTARRTRWLWLAYVVTAAAAVYTHYFAWFLLVALGCAWLLDARGVRTRHSGDSPAHPLTRFVQLLAANVAVVVLYLPWLANLWTQLRVDRSYWLGDLKLHEALLDAAISFTSGETMRENMALWLLPVYVLVTAVAWWGIWRTWPRGRRLALYGGFWLLVPLAAVLALAFNVPKFNARYVMLALPALLLLWAGGLAALAGARSTSGRVAPILSALCVLLLAGGALWSNANWFFNPNFAKDNWRQLTAFLRDRIAPDENIVLVSGHAWPVWEYYAPDLPVVRLPALEILDVDAVLDFATTQPPLAAAFAEETGKRGAWLVNWQDEVVDPNSVVPVQLELGGREKGQSATFTGLGLRRFGGIRASRFAAEPPVMHVLDTPFGDQVTLHGYTVANNGDLLLFWQRPTPANAAGDLHMALQTDTLDSQPLAHPPDRRLTGYTYPSFRWPPGQIIMGHVPAADWLGAIPVAGDEPYSATVQVTLRVYDGRDPAATPLLTAAGEDYLVLPKVEVVID
jgi:4-amino-4-deoxy-L-arabinose transferase-like glycosyltransferase